jgi:hypothetical protein
MGANALQWFDELGCRVAATWERAGFRADDWTRIATDALVDTPPAQHLGYEEIVQSIATLDRLTIEQNLRSDFGQPPLTVFLHPRFYIQALFWVTGSTSIHDHRFAGAFNVLSGASIQTTYEFECHAQPSDHVRIGQLSSTNACVLNIGDTHEIRPGTSFIHSVFHLSAPSVTIVIRTWGDNGDAPLEYLRPSVAFEPFYEDPLLVRRLQLLSMLYKLRSPQYVEMASTVVANADAFSRFSVLRHVFQRSSSYPGLFEALCAHAGERGDDIRAYTCAFELAERLSVCHKLQHQILEPDLRFFAGLLLTQDKPSAVGALVRAHAPDAEPEATTLRWLNRLRERRSLGLSFDPAGADAAARLSVGHDEARVIDHIGRTHPHVDARLTVRQAMSSRLLACLFSDTVASPAGNLAA